MDDLIPNFWVIIRVEENVLFQNVSCWHLQICHTWSFRKFPHSQSKKTQQNFKFTDFFKLSKTVLYCIFSISSFLWGGRGSDGRAGIHIWRLVDRSLATLVCVSKYPWAWYIHQSVSANVRFKKKNISKSAYTQIERKKEEEEKKKHCMIVSEIGWMRLVVRKCFSCSKWVEKHHVSKSPFTVVLD